MYAARLPRGAKEVALVSKWEGGTRTSGGNGAMPTLPVRQASSMQAAERNGSVVDDTGGCAGDVFVAVACDQEDGEVGSVR
jgi:hypothetical protein